MSPPISIPKENYTPILPFKFQGSKSTFTKHEYNPNLLNNPNILLNNDFTEKTKIFTQAFIDVYNKIYQLTKEYNLGSISIETDELYTHVFVIEVPKKDSYNEIIQLWDKIIDIIEEYCNQKGYNSYYKNIQIVLRR